MQSNKSLNSLWVSSEEVVRELDQYIERRAAKRSQSRGISKGTSSARVQTESLQSTLTKSEVVPTEAGPKSATKEQQTETPKVQTEIPLQNPVVPPKESLQTKINRAKLEWECVLKVMRADRENWIKEVFE